MLVDSLIPMQNYLRNAEQIPEMVNFVKSGGIFTKDNLSIFPKKKIEKTSKLLKIDDLIKIVRFEDGALFVHDGLHRATAIHIAGRKFLDPREFTIENWQYSWYMEINVEEKWFTPFDPRKEVRVKDIFVFKDTVEDFINRPPRPTKEEINHFILDHYEAQSYTEPRSANSIAEVAVLNTSTTPVEVD